MSNIITVSPAEIKKGDRLTGNHGWEALEDAKRVSEGKGRYAIHVPVRYFPDGGRSVREWDDRADIRFQVARGTEEVPSETFEFKVIVTGKERIEQISDALQAAGDGNLLVEIERLIGTRLLALDPREFVVMDQVPNGALSTTEILNSILVTEG